MRSGVAPSNTTAGVPDRGSPGATFTTEPQNPRAARAASTAKPPLGRNGIAGLESVCEHTKGLSSRIKSILLAGVSLPI